MYTIKLNFFIFVGIPREECGKFCYVADIYLSG